MELSGTKCTVLQRTPVCFFPRGKAGNELLWFFIRQPRFDSQEFAVIVLAIILPHLHTRLFPAVQRGFGEVNK